MNNSTISRPVRPSRLSVSWERAGDHAILVSRRRDWGSAIFLCLWLTGWTVGCVALAGVIIATPSLFSLLFAIPFWASWFFVAALILRAFFLRETLTLDGSGATYRRDVVMTGKERQVPLSEIKEFAEYSKVTDSESGRQTHGIEVRSTGLPIQMVEGIPRDELDWLKWELNDHLRSLDHHRGRASNDSRPVVSPVPRDARSEDDDDALNTAEEPAREPARKRRELRIGTTACQPPSDCRWQLVSEMGQFDAIVFEQRGSWSWAMLGFLVFINLFWNGIVAVFVCGGLLGLEPGNRQGAVDGVPRFGSLGWWGLFVFLIPFVAIGLVMLAGLLMTLFDPWRITRWEFSHDEIVCRWRWLGVVGRTWRYAGNRVSRIEVVSKVERKSLMNHAVNELAEWALVFVDRTGTEVATIPGLTEGEADWIGDTVLRERRSWFGRP